MNVKVIWYTTLMECLLMIKHKNQEEFQESIRARTVMDYNTVHVNGLLGDPKNDFLLFSC